MAITKTSNTSSHGNDVKDPMYTFLCNESIPNVFFLLVLSKLPRPARRALGETFRNREMVSDSLKVSCRCDVPSWLRPFGPPLEAW